MEIKPDYYHQNGTDVIEMIRLLKGEQAAKDFCAGNVLKYTIRFEKKNGVEDLRKAQTYLSRLIELEDKNELMTDKIQRIIKKEFGKTE